MASLTIPDTSNNSLSAPLGPIPTEGLYPSFQAIREHLESLASAHGYKIVNRDRQPPESSGKPVHTLTYACHKSRPPKNTLNLDLHPSKRRKVKGSKKENCPFKVKAHLQPDSQWTLEIKWGEHNHGPIDPALTPRPRKQPSDKIDWMRRKGQSPAIRLSAQAAQHTSENNDSGFITSPSTFPALGNLPPGRVIEATRNRRVGIPLPTRTGPASNLISRI